MVMVMRVKKLSKCFCKKILVLSVFLVFIFSCKSVPFSNYWHEEYEEFSSYSDKTWIVENNKIYGAKPDLNGPIGGGLGYKKIITKGDYTAETVNELLDALINTKYGDIIFIPGNTVLDFTALIYTENKSIKINDGVILASDRGYKGSSGALIRSLAFETEGLIRVTGKDVRISGIRLEGPDKERQLDHYSRAFNGKEIDGENIIPGHNYYYLFPSARGIIVDNDAVQIDNCELWGWSGSSILLKSGTKHKINNNYIHHNQRQGVGYGVSHGLSESLIEYNLFNFNRHSIAGSGIPGSGYIARNNVQLENSLSHCLDMHGGRDREDGTDISGSKIIIENNTFFSYRKAIALRGVPKEFAAIAGNIFFHKKLGPDIITDWPLPENVKVFDNLYDSEKILRDSK